MCLWVLPIVCACACVDAGDIDVAISGPGKADILKKEQTNGLVHVVYMPLTPGEYEISIKHKGRAIHGSPFSAKISGEKFTPH